MDGDEPLLRDARLRDAIRWTATRIPSFSWSLGGGPLGHGTAEELTGITTHLVTLFTSMRRWRQEEL